MTTDPAIEAIALAKLVGYGAAFFHAMLPLLGLCLGLGALALAFVPFRRS